MGSQLERSFFIGRKIFLLGIAYCYYMWSKIIVPYSGQNQLFLTLFQRTRILFDLLDHIVLFSPRLPRSCLISSRRKRNCQTLLAKTEEISGIEMNHQEVKRNKGITHKEVNPAIGLLCYRKEFRIQSRQYKEVISRFEIMPRFNSPTKCCLKYLLAQLSLTC